MVVVAGMALVASACGTSSSSGRTIGTNPYTVAQALRGPLGYSEAVDRRALTDWVFKSVPTGQFPDSPPVNRGMALLTNAAVGQDRGRYVSVMAFATPQQADTFTAWFAANGAKARLADRVVTCGTILFLGSDLSDNGDGVRNLDSALRARYNCTPATRSAAK